GGGGELVRRDPRTLAPLEVIPVRCEGERVGGLNDLEWSGGRVWANIITRPYLAGIDLGSGEVTDIVDAHLGEHHWGDPQAVLNGIAAMPEPGGTGDDAGEPLEFLLTGKGWRFLHHVRLAGGRHRRQPARLLVPASWPPPARARPRGRAGVPRRGAARSAGRWPGVGRRPAPAAPARAAPPGSPARSARGSGAAPGRRRARGGSPAAWAGRAGRPGPT